MAQLFKFTGIHPNEFPGATFKAEDAIPVAQCATAPAVPGDEAGIVVAAIAAGKAYTFLNGKLYTDMTVGEMTAYCATTYAPAT